MRRIDNIREKKNKLAGASGKDERQHSGEKVDNKETTAKKSKVKTQKEVAE